MNIARGIKRHNERIATNQKPGLIADIVTACVGLVFVVLFLFAMLFVAMFASIYLLGKCGAQVCEDVHFRWMQ